MSAREGLSFPVQIRFGDIDSYGHVNNVVYLSYLEDARVQLIHRALGQDAGAGAVEEDTFHDLVGVENFTLVARHEIEYVRPLLFTTDPVNVNIWVTGIGGSSFEFGYEVASADGSEVYALAASSMVLVSRASGLPVRLTRAQRHALERWSGEPVPFRRRR
ncbi:MULTISPECIES: thioesterase family protein [Arthrobacter]|uniref:Thioesterase family protein n=2 Tax=Arthrobacter TaxID=1663 RepID=A0ABU9KFI2_9MICC|nr:thioesterase family protein [Arthrobacter sp. YJM1]MDP5225640.1 thioesterase family protein [Arthrobacter sp. YJM1]